MVGWRFACMLGHAMALVTVFYTKDTNIIASSGGVWMDAAAVESYKKTSAYTTKDTEMFRWMIVAAASLAFQFFGLISGMSMFFLRINAFYILLHFIGLISLS